ncbi:MAG: hypothetical protein ABXS91_04660 [Sulfurimonas sp.]
MKKYLMMGLSMSAVWMMGCGGGGSGSSVDVAEVIEDKDFYRYFSGDEQYYKELFDGNGTLIKEIYDLDDDLNDTVTSEYQIGSPYVYIIENNVTEKCRVKETNASVIFLCHEEGTTSAEVETIRWKTYEDAEEHPEDE